MAFPPASSRALAVAAFFALSIPGFSSRAGGDQSLSLGASHEAYFAGQESLYGPRSHQLVSGRYSGEASGSWIAARLDVGGIHGTSVARYSSVFAPEAYLRFRQDAIPWLPREITLGRMKEAWSRLDEDWQLGLVQPLFRFDYLRPEQQGLTGAFLTWKSDRARFVLFASGVYIPEQGPPFHISDGEISSASPWFTEPTNELILFQQPTDIRYRVAIPEVADIVSRGTVGGLFVLGGGPTDANSADPGSAPWNSGPWSSGGYLFKPRNSLMLPFTAPLVLGPSTQFAEVTIDPRVERHHIAMFDIGYRSGLQAAFISALAEFPQNPPVQAGVTRQRLEPQVLVSPGFETRLFRRRSWGPSARIAYLHQDGGETPEEGPFATGRGTIFGPRLSWTRAASLVLKSNFLSTAESSLDVSVRWIEDFRQRGTWLMTEVLYAPALGWTVSLSADILGSAAPVDDQQGLINRFRGNDRVSGGVRYAF